MWMAYFCFSAYLEERCRSTLAQTFPEHSLAFRIWTAKSRATTTCMIFHSFWFWLTLTSREIRTVHFSMFFVMRHDVAPLGEVVPQVLRSEPAGACCSSHLQWAPELSSHGNQGVGVCSCALSWGGGDRQSEPANKTPQKLSRLTPFPLSVLEWTGNNKIIRALKLWKTKEKTRNKTRLERSRRQNYWNAKWASFNM